MVREGVKTLTKFDRLLTLLVGMQMGIGLHGTWPWITLPVSVLAVVLIIGDLIHTHRKVRRVEQEAIDE